jgi:hypothetical protein
MAGCDKLLGTLDTGARVGSVFGLLSVTRAILTGERDAVAAP